MTTACGGWQRRRVWSGCLLACVVAGVLPGAAQLRSAPIQGAAPPESATGTVTGRVICGDTQRPARFAQVELQSVAAAAAQSGDGVSFRDRFFGGSTSGRTGVDGTFTLSGVAPGDYYATATAPGYVPERQVLEAETEAGESAADMMAGLPQVHVAADGSSSVTIMIQRGAVISGRVVWEDGSPASGLVVDPVMSATATLPSAVARVQSLRSFRGNTTDDRGVFRLTGLPGGNYLLEALIQADSGGRGGRGFSPPHWIRVYAPGVFRRSEAKAVSLRGGEERDDVRMVVDLSGLRTVGGQLGSTASGLVVASGRVSLIDPNDNTLRLQGSVEPDGSFSVPYVPPGTYTLQVSGASTSAGFSFGRRGGGDSAQTGSATSFQPFTQTVEVHDVDVTDLSFNLTPVTQPAAAQ